MRPENVAAVAGLVDHTVQGDGDQLEQLLINIVSKRVRQLGLGHRPMVETTPRMSLTDIALKEIIEGKLAYEPLQGSSEGT